VAGKQDEAEAARWLAKAEAAGVSANGKAPAAQSESALSAPVKLPNAN
jgi:hypothetical protein